MKRKHSVTMGGLHPKEPTSNTLEVMVREQEISGAFPRGYLLTISYLQALYTLAM